MPKNKPINSRRTLPRGYEYVSCDLCGQDDTEKVLEAKDLYNNIPGIFNVVQCKNCDFIYTNPRPYGEELAKYYPDETGYFQPVAHNAKRGKLAKLAQHISKKILNAYRGYNLPNSPGWLEKVILLPVYLLAKRNWEITAIPRYRQNGRILDVGCSYGGYLKLMKDIGWEVVGVEPNKKAAEFGCSEYSIQIINDAFETAEIAGHFDVITMRMTLEHIPSPSKVLDKASRLLKEDGKIIIIVPDYSGIEFRLFKEYCYTLHLPNHLNHFTPATIRKYCVKHGFKVLKVVHHKFDRDFVASTQYMSNDGHAKWLATTFSNRMFRTTLLKAAVHLLSYLGMTSRMTIWAEKVGKSAQ